MVAPVSTLATGADILRNIYMGGEKKKGNKKKVYQISSQFKI